MGDGGYRQALGSTLEAVMHREPPGEEDVPPEADREQELDRLIPIKHPYAVCYPCH